MRCDTENNDNWNQTYDDEHTEPVTVYKYGRRPIISYSEQFEKERKVQNVKVQNNNALW